MSLMPKSSLNIHHHPTCVRELYYVVVCPAGFHHMALLLSSQQPTHAKHNHIAHFSSNQNTLVPQHNLKIVPQIFLLLHFEKFQHFWVEQELVHKLYSHYRALNWSKLYWLWVEDAFLFRNPYTRLLCPNVNMYMLITRRKAFRNILRKYFQIGQATHMWKYNVMS